MSDTAAPSTSSWWAGWLSPFAMFGAQRTSSSGNPTSQPPSATPSASEPTTPAIRASGFDSMNGNTAKPASQVDSSGAATTTSALPLQDPQLSSLPPPASRSPVLPVPPPSVSIGGGGKGDELTSCVVLPGPQALFVRQRSLSFRAPQPHQPQNPHVDSYGGSSINSNHVATGAPTAAMGAGGAGKGEDGRDSFGVLSPSASQSAGVRQFHKDKDMDRFLRSA